MCGLVGIAGKLAFKDEATMKRLLLLDFFRGVDSTGLAAVRTNGDVQVAKIASHPLDLFDSTKFKTALNGNTSRAFIGHNRAATRGLVNGLNAHPFLIDHIVGAHNGTLDHQSFNRLEDALKEKFSVDSMAVIAGIARLGLDETISLLTGSWSLVWFDQKEGSLNFLRNKDRPLWYAYTKEFDRLIWASEYPMIQHAAQMGDNYDLHSEKAKDKDAHYSFWQTDPNIHYKFDLAELVAGGTTRPKPKARLVEGKKYTPTTGNYTGGFNNTGHPFDPWKRRKEEEEAEKLVTVTTTVDGKTTTTTYPSSSKSKKKDAKPDNLYHIIGNTEKPFGGLIDEARFDDLAKYGCCWCGDNVAWGDIGVTIYDRDDILLCPTCSKKADKPIQTRIFTDNINPILM